MIRKNLVLFEDAVKGSLDVEEYDALLTGENGEFVLAYYQAECISDNLDDWTLCFEGQLCDWVLNTALMSKAMNFLKDWIDKRVLIGVEEMLVYEKGNYYIKDSVGKFIDSKVVIEGDSYALLTDCEVVSSGMSTIHLTGASNLVSYGKDAIYLLEHSKGMVYGPSWVNANNNAYVEIYGNVKVDASGYAYIVAHNELASISLSLNAIVEREEVTEEQQEHVRALCG